VIITNWIIKTKRLEEYNLVKILNNNGRGLGKLLPDYTNLNNTQGIKKKKILRC